MIKRRESKETQENWWSYVHKCNENSWVFAKNGLWSLEVAVRPRGQTCHQNLIFIKLYIITVRRGDRLGLTFAVLNLIC